MKKINKSIIVILALSLAFIITVTLSFSWFSRPNGTDSTKYRGLQYTGSAIIKSEQDILITTYKCSLQSGNLDNIVAVNTGDSFTIKAGESQYFRSVLSNTSTSENSVSLTGLSVTGTTDLQVCNFYPLKDYENYSDGITFAKHITVEASGNTNVDWFLYNKSGSDVTITIASLPQVSYND